MTISRVFYRRGQHGIGRAKLGCVVLDIKKRKQYAVGYNQYNTDCNTQYRNHPPQTVHAEAHAMEKLRPNHKKHPTKVDIVVYRVTRTRDPTTGDLLCGMAKSCDACKRCMSRTLRKKGYTLRRLLYTDADGNLQQDHI